MSSLSLTKNRIQANRNYLDHAICKSLNLFQTDDPACFYYKLTRIMQKNNKFHHMSNTIPTKPPPTHNTCMNNCLKHEPLHPLVHASNKMEQNDTCSLSSSICSNQDYSPSKHNHPFFDKSLQTHSPIINECTCSSFDLQSPLTNEQHEQYILNSKPLRKRKRFRKTLYSTNTNNNHTTQPKHNNNNNTSNDFMNKAQYINIQGKHKQTNKISKKNTTEPKKKGPKKKLLSNRDIINTFHLPQPQAAKELGISLSTLKRRWGEVRKELGMDKWPYPIYQRDVQEIISNLKGTTQERSLIFKVLKLDPHTIPSNYPLQKPDTHKENSNVLCSSDQKSIHNNNSSSSNQNEQSIPLNTPHSLKKDSLNDKYMNAQLLNECSINDEKNIDFASLCNLMVAFEKYSTPSSPSSSSKQ